MNEATGFPALVSGGVSLGAVFVAIWLGRANLTWVLGLPKAGNPAWEGRDRFLVWLALSSVMTLSLLQLTSLAIAIAELPAILSTPGGSRLFPSGWGVGSYELHLTLRALTVLVAYVLAGRLAWPRFRGLFESSPGPARGPAAARIAVLLGAGGLAFVLADGISSGVQRLPVSEWVTVADPLAGYLAGWLASIGVMAVVLGFMSSRLDSQSKPGRQSK